MGRSEHAHMDQEEDKDICSQSVSQSEYTPMLVLTQPFTIKISPEEKFRVGMEVGLNVVELAR